MADFAHYARIMMHHEAYVPYGADSHPIEEMYAMTAHNTGVTVLPSDPGGATMMGITIGTFRQFYGAERTVADLGRMTYRQWAAIVKTLYWDKIKADNINNQSIADMCVDWIIHRGYTPIKKMQKALGVSADGIVGPKTLAAFNGPNPKEIHHNLKTARYIDYNDLLTKKGGSYERTFRKGFMNRVESFEFYE